MRVLLLTCLIYSVAASASAEDLFVGTYESETRENFGSDTPGEYRIEVVATAGGKYEATTIHRGKTLGKRVLFPCPVDKEGYLSSRLPGRAEVLCTDMGYGAIFPVLSYAENGIGVPALKSKYIANPALVEQEGLKPGDPALFEARYYKAKYYGHVTWYCYGFRKVRTGT